VKRRTTQQLTAEGAAPCSHEISSLEPFSKELARLARDIAQEIDRGRLTPRCLSGLIAMKPLIGWIQGAVFKILSTTEEVGSCGHNCNHDDDNNVEVPSDDETDADDEGSGLAPGYL